MSTRLSFRVTTTVALVISALALTASASPATSSSLRSPEWMRQAAIRATSPVGGALTEAELPGSSNPSEPYAAASQSASAYRGKIHFTSTNASRMSVNPVTGDLSLSLGDLFVPERGVRLGLSLTYNSYFASTDGPFGRGWSFNAGMSLTEASNGTVTISQENGSQVTFRHPLTGYVAAPRVIASLRQLRDTLVLTRGTRGKNCPRYSRSCVKFFFSEPVGLTPGRLVKIASADGGLTLVYNKRNQLTSMRDPGGRTLSFAYVNGKVQSAALDANGGLGDNLTYDSNGNLRSWSNAAGGRLGFLYDASHRMTGIVDPRGVETDIVYDTQGKVQSITGPTGETDFTRTAGRTSVSPPGGPTTTAYYADGEVTRVDQGDPSAPLATTLITYDPSTLGPTALTNPDGHTSHMSYDALGHLTSFTDPLNHTSTYHFGTATGVITATDPLGNVSQATTDSTGRLITIAMSASDPNLTENTVFHYASTAHPGDVTSVTDPEGHLWQFTYDKFGNQTSSTDPLGETSSTVYDRMGRPAINTVGSGTFGGVHQDGFSTTYTYDPEGRLLSSTDPLGNTKSFSYDLAGNLVASVAGGHQTSYGYDAAGRWVLVSRPSGSHASLSYRVGGPVGEVCDDGNNCEEYTYDDLGRPHTFTDALGHTSSFVYSPGGMLLSSTDANGVTTSYTHDDDGRTTGVSYSDGITHPVAVDFDADGRMLHITDGTGTTSFTYDSLSRMTGEDKGLNPLGYDYDHMNRVIKVTKSSAVVENMVYDAAGRMTSVIDRLGNATTFSYDASSNVTQTLFPGGDFDRDGYDDAGRIESFNRYDTNGDPSSSINYRRNLLGQITEADQTGTGQPTQAYDYDADGRLGSVNTSSLIWSPRSNLVQNAAGDTFTYDAANRLVSEDQKDITPDVNWQFGYDDNGSRTNAFTLDGTRSHDFVWDAAGNLASFSDGSTTESNTYDGLGRQVSSSSGGTTHLAVWASTHAGSRMWERPDEDCNELPDDRMSCAIASTGTTPSYLWQDNGDLAFLAGRREAADNDCFCRSALGNGSAGVFISRATAQSTAAPSGPLAIDGTVYLYGPDGLPVEQLDGSDHPLFYHHDALGSTRAVTDETGNAVAIVAYDSLGNTGPRSGIVVPFGFGGAYTDPVSHLVLIGHDYYDPATGQFLTNRAGPGTVSDLGTADIEEEVGNLRRGITDNIGPPRAADFELFFDMYEGANCKSNETCGNGIFSTSRERGGSRAEFHACDFALVRCGSQAPLVDGAPPALLGTSPYAFGGGDPVNALTHSGESKPLQIKVKYD